ncbi:AMP-binding protein [Brevibacterium aurantiacum]|uniref:AMP-binding protein n=1 Tax=Brevibacterium aurantiacum TaxID=273384 RepID=UPI00186950D7|nr:AMP-binding protein [Brevibacterium aurantiacum]
MIDLPNIDVATGKEMDIVAMLEIRANEHPERVFIRTSESELTYGDAHNRSKRLAGAFSTLGVRPGTSVVVLMDNSVEQVLVWFALARLGALHVPINTGLVGDRLKHVLCVSSCQVAVIDPQFKDVLDTASDEKTRPHITVINSEGGMREDTVRLADLEASGSPYERSTWEPLDIATLMYTSGTTGQSKACSLSRRYLAAQGSGHARHFRITDEDVLYSPFPLFHIDGATLTIVAALSAGATAALSRRFSVSRYWHEVRTFKATVFNFMGATLSLLWKQPARDDDRDHRVRLAWGVPMPEWQTQWEQRFGFPLYQVYGSTDAGVPVYDPVDGTQKPGRCGQVTSLYEVRIDNGLGGEPSGSVGEILVRGKVPGLTMSGYYGMPRATAVTINEGGWVHTGDLGSLDGDQFLTFVGRLSDSIRRRGENISAFEVEELIATHPDVLEVAAVGVPSDLTEEDLKVCVVVVDNSRLTFEQLYDYCLATMPRHMVPRYFEFLTDLPKTPTQKVEKSSLKKGGHVQIWDSEAG